MTLLKIKEVMQSQTAFLREKESELLLSITELSDCETAEKAACIYAAEKHSYSFEGYLYQLDKLKTLLLAGIPTELALEAADSCVDVQTIIGFYRRYKT